MVKLWKSFALFMVLVLVVALGGAIVPASPALAATINVNPSMPTAAINAAIAGATSVDTIQFAGGTYNLTAPLVVAVAGVTLQGDTTTPGNVVVNAPASGGVDRDVFQVKADGVTIEGFKIQGAHFAGWGHGWQNAGIMVGNDGSAHGRTLMDDAATYDGLSVTVTRNEIADCEYGMYLYEIHDSTITYNTITDAAHGVPWAGDAIHLYFESGTEYVTDNDVSHNTMDNVRNGVMFNTGPPNPITHDFSGNNVEGNTITNVWNTGIVFQSGSGTSASPITIKNNSIDTSTGAKPGDEQNPNGLITVYTNYTQITGNTVTNSCHHGIWVDGSHHTVTGNTVTSNSKAGIHVGHYKQVEPVYWPFGDLTREDITISYNTVTGGMYGIYIGGGDASNVAISHNDLHGNSKYGLQAIGLGSDVSFINVSLNYIHDNGRNGLKLVDVTDCTIDSNEFADNGFGSLATKPEYKYGVFVEDERYNAASYSPCIRNTFVGNSFHGNALGAIDMEVMGNAVGSYWSSTEFLEDTVVHDNNFYGDSSVWGINVSNDYKDDGTQDGFGPIATVDATNNWWGDATGPKQATTNPCASGAAVSDNVDYTPWLDAAYPGGSQRLYNVENVTQSTTHNCIQDAIDAASLGDTINVAVGTYTENVVIAKSLDLLGVSSTTTVIDGNHAGNTVTITASDVSLSGFTVTGGSAASGKGVFYPEGGVVVDGNGGVSALTGITIQDNIIRNNLGNGVYVSAAGDGGAANNVVIEDCQIFNNGAAGNYAGVSLTHPNYILRPVGTWDEWRRPKNILVQGNTIHTNSNYGLYLSAGQDNVILSNEIWGNSKYGLQLASSWNRTDIPCEYTTVEDNEIHDNARNGVKLTSYNQHNTFTGNTISNNGYAGTSDRYKYGFLFQDGNDNIIENNTITGNALGGLYLWGKGDPSYTWYSTTNNTITGNTISNHTAVGGHGIHIPVSYGNPNSGFLNSSINFNNITNNLAYGLENADTTQTVDAEYNWWGDASGPSPVGPGTGDAVSANVDYDPWLGALWVEIGQLSQEDFRKDKAWAGQQKALLNKLDAVLEKIEAGEFGDAIDKLQHDVRDKIEKWVDDPPQSDLIEMVDALISALEALLE